jgi:hypothetical protein
MVQSGVMGDRAMIVHTRHLAWIALFEVFQEIHPKNPIPAKEWQTLSFLIETLREEKRLDDWAAVSRALHSIDGDRCISTPESWRKLYDSLDKLWADERINEATPEELDAHSGAFTKFRLVD